MMQALQKFLLLYLLTSLGSKALASEIIQGHKAPANSLQFMASVQDRNGHHRCGGSLISDNFVLTAAHCDEAVPARVVLGTHNLRNRGTVRRVAQRCKHPDYNDRTITSDIMLLKLSPKVSVGGTIKHIRLPLSNMTVKADQMCRVAGWGVTETGRSVLDLRYVDVSVVGQDVCKRKWGHLLPANVICAGGFGTLEGACNGDSGSPLVYNGTAVGIASFVFRGCKNPLFPNVYTEVAKFRKWINKVVRKNGC